jgi:hypothetical protein
MCKAGDAGDPGDLSWALAPGRVLMITALKKEKPDSAEPG